MADIGVYFNALIHYDCLLLIKRYQNELQKSRTKNLLYNPSPLAGEGRVRGIGESAASQISRRFSVLLDKDKNLNKKLKNICSRLKVV